MARGFLFCFIGGPAAKPTKALLLRTACRLLGRVARHTIVQADKGGGQQQALFGYLRYRRLLRAIDTTVLPCALFTRLRGGERTPGQRALRACGTDW